jgi:hypothetical protein
MEPAGSLPHSQKPATCPYLSQINPIHATYIYVLSTLDQKNGM